MKKCIAVLVSFVLLGVGIFSVPNSLVAEKQNNDIDGRYFTHFDEWKVIDDPPYNKIWLEPELGDMLFKTVQSGATCIGAVHTPTVGEIIACQLHISGLGSGFYNFIDITYRWENGQEQESITLPHNELYADTILFVQKGPSSYQEITVTVSSGGFCSANVAVDVEWFYAGNDEPYQPSTPPYYLNFDRFEWGSNQYGDALVHNKQADIALFTDQPNGNAFAYGETDTWYDNSNCKCPYIGIKVHIMGYVSGRGWAEMETVYEWDEYAIEKEWAFFGGPGEGNFIDETWVFTDHYYLSKVQSYFADLSVGSATEANLFIDVEWFYEGCGPPSPPV
jgi:hypothetical protein